MRLISRAPVTEKTPRRAGQHERVDSARKRTSSARCALGGSPQRRTGQKPLPTDGPDTSKAGIGRRRRRRSPEEGDASARVASRKPRSATACSTRPARRIAPALRRCAGRCGSSTRSGGTPRRTPAVANGFLYANFDAGLLAAYDVAACETGPQCVPVLTGDAASTPVERWHALRRQLQQ